MPSTTPGKPISTKPLKWSAAGAPLDDYVEGPPSLNTADELAKQVRLKNAELTKAKAAKAKAAKDLEAARAPAAGDMLSGLSCGVDVTCGDSPMDEEECEAMLKKVSAKQASLEKELAELAKAQKAQAKWERDNAVVASCGCFAMPCVTGEEDDEEARAAAAYHY